MNKKAKRHPQITICEIECPRCGKTYFVTGDDEDSIEESGDIYECSSCDFEGDLSEWPLQEYSRGRISFDSGELILKEEDW